MLQALPCGQFSGVVLLVDLDLASAEAEPELEPPQFFDKRFKVIFPSDRPGPAKSHLFFILHQRPESAGVLLEPLGDLAQ
jgi:hypothetical protein